MFDRILQIIDKCSSEKFPKPVVDDALMVYFEKGRTASEQFLITTKNFSLSHATELVSGIEKENNRLNRQALLINTIGFFGMLISFFVSIIARSYVSVSTFGAAAILWGRAWIKSLVRYIDGERKAREFSSQTL